MDIPPGTGEALSHVGTGLAMLANRGLIEKVFGPTADYLGDKTAGLFRKADVNLDAILGRLVRILGSQIDQPGQINARVVVNVVQDGAFCEDPLMQEYYAGILASSRSPDGFDDRGVQHASLVRSLSAYQLRLHYLMYRELQRVLLSVDRHYPLLEDGERQQCRVHVPDATLLLLVPPPHDPDLCRHAKAGLIAHDLGINWATKSANAARRRREGVTSLAPTARGLELYLWGTGQRGVTQASFGSEETLPEPLFPIPDGCYVPNVEDPDGSKGM